LRYSLGVLSIASEILAGYKWFSVRHRLYSSTARAKAKRDALRTEIVGVQSRMKAAEAEPGIRRDYRIVGARQYLGEAARGESSHAHLRRAAIGVAIAILVVAGVLLFAAVAGAQAPPGNARVRVGLLDLTKSSSSEDFQANVAAIEQIISSLPDDGRIVVVGISDAFGKPRPLLDRTIRGKGSFGLELQAAREVAAAEWRKVAGALNLTYENTNLLGTIELLPYLVEGGNYDLVIFSDARENVLVNIDHVDQINVPLVLKGLQRKRAIPSMPQVRVFMLGVTPERKTAEYFRSLNEFWDAYFKTAGARLEAFRVDRRLTF
jgi:hypothetical protein